MYLVIGTRIIGHVVVQVSLVKRGDHGGVLVDKLCDQRQQAKKPADPFRSPNREDPQMVPIGKKLKADGHTAVWPSV